MCKDVLQKFSIKLKATRQKKGLTQDELSCDSGISRSTIGMLETAKRDITLQKLEKIAKALNVEMWELIKFD